MRWATGLVSSLAEAWQELRVHRMRVLLSLIVVAISVAAFTAVVALGQMLNQGFQESMERSSGRPALVSLSAYNPDTGAMPEAGVLQRAFAESMERHGIEWSSRVAWLEVVPPADGWADVRAVDADFGVMHRVPLVEGAWFGERDEARLVPTAVINESWWQRLGAPALTGSPRVDIELQTWSEDGMPTAAGSFEAIVVGVMPDQNTGGQYAQSGYILYDQAGSVLSPEVLGANTSYEAWIPPETADELMESLRASFGLHLGEGFQVDAYRMDYEAQMQDGYDPFGPMLLVLGGISILVLALGALSLLNITLVTTRFRIREIGVRRSFGATGGRVFFSVMLESVVGTVVAGVVGIVLAIFALRLPVVQENMFAGLQDAVAFPMSAAVTGLLVSAGVGALTGLVPALIAMRVRPIDAIRF
jgi:putative ABC transport system permease protein